MNALEMPDKPQKWNWAQWLKNLASRYNLFTRPAPFGLVMPRVYRGYTSNDCCCFLGEMVSTGDFYHTYISFCNHFPGYTDSICIVDIETGIIM